MERSQVHITKTNEQPFSVESRRKREIRCWSIRERERETEIDWRGIVRLSGRVTERLGG